MLDPPLIIIVLDSAVCALVSSLRKVLLEAALAAFLAARASSLLSVLLFFGTTAPSDPAK